MPRSAEPLFEECQDTPPGVLGSRRIVIPSLLVKEGMFCARVDGNVVGNLVFVQCDIEFPACLRGEIVGGV